MMHFSLLTSNRILYINLCLKLIPLFHAKGGFRRLRFFREKVNGNYLDNYEVDERNGVSDADSTESDVRCSEDRVRDNRGLEAASGVLRVGEDRCNEEGDDEDGDDPNNCSCSSRDGTHFQRNFDQNRQNNQYQNENKNNIYDDEASPSSSDREFRIYHFHEMSPVIESNNLSPPFMDAENKKIMRNKKKNVVANSTEECDKRVEKNDSTLMQQYAKDLYKDENKKNEGYHKSSRLKNDNNIYEKKNFHDIENCIKRQIIEIKKNQLFPELQEHLIRRYSYPHNTHATQTDAIENYFPMTERNTEFASNLGLNNAVSGADFQTSNPSFVAVKVIRFDKQKLGLIFSKVNIF
jgi:hypothetical protein